MKFADLINRTSTVSISYREQTINLIIFSEKLTPNYKASLLKLAEQNEDHEVEVQMLADLIQSWDITDEEGQPIKPTYEFLLGCPLPFLSELGKAVLNEVADANPPQTNPQQPS